MQNEDRRELGKFCVRAAEIMLAFLVAGPTAAFFLGKEVPLKTFLVVLAVGSAAVLTFLALAVIIFKRWN